MGTLGNQPERNSYLVSNQDIDYFLEDATKLAKKYSTTIEAVIGAKQALEMERKNSILSLDGDYRDEQMGGFGEILSRIATALEEKT